MAYYRKKSFRRRRKSYRNKRSVGVKKNSRAIEHIKQSLKEDVQRTTLVHQVNNDVLTATTVHPIVPCVMGSADSPAWSPGYFSSALLGDKFAQATCGRVYMDMAFTTYTEKQPVTFTVMHIKATKDMADIMLNSSAMGITLANIDGNQYSYRGQVVTTTGAASLFGTVSLNPQFFNVVKRWDFTLGSTLDNSSGTDSVSVLGNTHKAIKYSFPTGYKMGTSQTGGWWATPPELICRNEVLNWIVVFSDNITGLDLGYPSYTINSMCTVTACA